MAQHPAHRRLRRFIDVPTMASPGSPLPGSRETPPISRQGSVASRNVWLHEHVAQSRQARGTDLVQAAHRSSRRLGQRCSRRPGRSRAWMREPDSLSAVSDEKPAQTIDPAARCSRVTRTPPVGRGPGRGIQFTRREPQLNQRSEWVCPPFVFSRRRA
jgi:hypothetical protein